MRFDTKFSAHVEQLFSAPRQLLQVEIAAIVQSELGVTFNAAMLPLLQKMDAETRMVVWQLLALHQPMIAVQQQKGFHLLCGQRTLHLYQHLFPDLQQVPLYIITEPRRGLQSQLYSLQNIGVALSATAMRFESNCMAAMWMQQVLSNTPFATETGDIQIDTLAQLFGVTTKTIANWQS